MKLRMIPAVMAALCLAALGVSGQAKIKVLSTNAVKSALEKMLPQAEKAVGRPLSVEFSSTASLKQRIAGGEAFDAAILTRDALDDLTKQKKLAAGGVDPHGPAPVRHAVGGLSGGWIRWACPRELGLPFSADQFDAPAAIQRGG